MLLSLFCFVSLPAIMRHFSLSKLSSKFSRPFSFYDSELLTTNAQIPNIEYIRVLKVLGNLTTVSLSTYISNSFHIQVLVAFWLWFPQVHFSSNFSSLTSLHSLKKLYSWPLSFGFSTPTVVTPTKVTNSYWITKLEVEKKDIQKEI